MLDPFSKLNKFVLLILMTKSYMGKATRLESIHALVVEKTEVLEDGHLILWNKLDLALSGRSPSQVMWG